MTLFHIQYTHHFQSKDLSKWKSINDIIQLCEIMKISIFHFKNHWNLGTRIFQFIRFLSGEIPKFHLVSFFSHTLPWTLQSVSNKLLGKERDKETKQTEPSCILPFINVYIKRTVPQGWQQFVNCCHSKDFYVNLSTRLLVAFLLVLTLNKVLEINDMKSWRLFITNYI